MASSGTHHLHLLFFPFLARSHMIPMLETARIAAHRGVRVTIVTTHANAALVRPTVDISTSSGHPMELLLLPFPCAEFGLPEGCENLTSLPPQLAANFFSAIATLRRPLDRILRDQLPDCLVSDALFSWTTELAGVHRIPRIIFQVTGLFPLCVANELDLHRPYENASDRNEPFVVPGLPHRVELTRSQIPEVFNYPVMLDMLRDAELGSYGVLVNSVYGLEPDYAEHYYKVAPRKVYCVGPVSLAGKGDKDGGGNPNSTSRHSCLSWLDSKETNSVVYVSFGTLCRFTDEQLRELALGLESSGHPFIWAARTGRESDWLPEGYEARVEGKGLIMGDWAPQIEILNHRAVGGFVIHCGWNSVMEGVCAGVPMVTWPLHSEQFLIEKLIVEVLKIGRMAWEGFKSIADEERVVIEADVIGKAVARLMDGGEEVDAMRRRVEEYGKMARAAVGVGGSSYADMSRLIDELLSHREAQRSNKV